MFWHYLFFCLFLYSSKCNFNNTTAFLLTSGNMTAVMTSNYITGPLTSDNTTAVLTSDNTAVRLASCA